MSLSSVSSSDILNVNIILVETNVNIILVIKNQERRRTDNKPFGWLLRRVALAEGKDEFVHLPLQVVDGLASLPLLLLNHGVIEGTLPPAGAGGEWWLGSRGGVAVWGWRTWSFTEPTTAANDGLEEPGAA